VGLPTMPREPFIFVYLYPDPVGRASTTEHPVDLMMKDHDI
jgi:hypothetical protein